MICDVSAGQASDSSWRKNHLHNLPAAITSRRGPSRIAPTPGSQLRSGYALPSSRARRNSLTLIDALFHPDRRATSNVQFSANLEFRPARIGQCKYPGISSPLGISDTPASVSAACQVAESQNEKRRIDCRSGRQADPYTSGAKTDLQAEPIAEGKADQPPTNDRKQKRHSRVL